ncbi:MAG: type I-C CRISPR-associated endonuclease Cas1c [Candidatus Goldbacteria bacterium]|nr:type I-C CRISPR-associated endonuclease Cas1c [Candidatus Goldiibacteriota bacterium]
MRKLLNVLYVTTPEAYLSRDGENIVVRIEEKECFRVPVHNLESIIYFGYKGVSHSVLGMCAEKGICFTFLSPNGRFLARVEGPVSGNVLLRKKQYRISDDKTESAKLAKLFVMAKITNARTVLSRAIRDHSDNINIEKVKKVINDLALMIYKVERNTDLEEIRGIEGMASNLYFSVFNELIVAQKDDFYFKDRSRRPPRDNINALLSFVYTLLVHDCRSALETVGLDPAVGFLHRDRPGRPSLALDLMEELRSYMADRIVLSLINRLQVTKDSFEKSEGGEIRMNETAKRILLETWQKRKMEEITHPFIGEKIEVGLIPYCQALLLARFMRGDIENYPPFFCK